MKFDLLLILNKGHAIIDFGSKIKALGYRKAHRFPNHLHLRSLVHAYGRLSPIIEHVQPSKFFAAAVKILSRSFEQ